MKTTKKDVFTMIYQFIGAGIVFWFCILSESPGHITSRVIYPLEFIGIETGTTIGLFVMNVVLILGYFGLFYQRKHHITHSNGYT